MNVNFMLIFKRKIEFLFKLINRRINVYNYIKMYQTESGIYILKY